MPPYLLNADVDRTQLECEKFRVSLPKLSEINNNMPIQSNGNFMLVKTDIAHSKSHDFYGVFGENTVESMPEEFIYEVPVPKSKGPKNRSLTPISIMAVDTIELVKSRKITESVI